ncbi:hypothetical protein CYMTET_37962 [Cymbomonas tetramitiformis]|uniref:Uncharacterized protein n=1 Tax=Cymbomonas tetramitiformis TaxID=36881 RepID=A0AAE0F5G1_9CHLO|nr:hypothetical protein CYMTET_37962 [Cymbomonas tetramitiformis]
MFVAEGEAKYWRARKLLNAESRLVKSSNANRASLTEIGRQLHDAALKRNLTDLNATQTSRSTPPARLTPISDTSTQTAIPLVKYEGIEEPKWKAEPLMHWLLNPAGSS